MTKTRVKTFPAGPLKRIHVYAQRIRAYPKTKVDEASIIIRANGKSYHARYVQVDGYCVLVQDLANGMPGCRNAKVWVETRSRVSIQQQLPDAPQHKAPPEVANDPKVIPFSVAAFGRVPIKR